MGQYTILKIGRVVFQWKYYVPSFLTFLFEERDYFARPMRLKYEDDWFEEIGYRTTCGKSKGKMDELGYTLEFFAEVYDSFHDELEEELRERLAEEFAEEDGPNGCADEKVDTHLGHFPAQSRISDLTDFVKFLRRAVADDFDTSEFREPRRFEIGDGKEISVPSREYIQWRRELDLADFESLQMYLLDKARLLSPSVVKLLSLFEEGYLFDYPEVISLMYCRLLLDAVNEEEEIVLDLHDIVDSADEVQKMHSKLAVGLAEKVYLYNRVFKILSDKEADVRERYAKSLGRSLLTQLDRCASSDERGKQLEGLMEVAFTSHPQLSVVEKRYSTGDEEIDLIVKNDLSGGFWTGLGSPLMFVECKNWSQPVGSREVRDFEIKLQNHRPLVRMGLLIAPGGFSKECESELKRMSRDDYAIVLVNLAEIHRFFDGGRGLPEWLEELICRPV